MPPPAEQPEGREPPSDAVAAQPARARLVHFLCRRRADRFRAVRLGLSHHAALDAGRYRARSVRGGLRLADRPNAGRRAGRCREIGALRRRHRGRRHLRQRLDLCGAADLSDGAGRIGAARARELRARPGHGRDQPRPRRPCRDRRTARPQCALCFGRQRTGGGGDGRLRLSYFRARRFHRHGASARAGAVRAALDLRQRDRSRARPWRAAAAAADQAADQAGRADAQSAAADLRRLSASVSSRQCGHAAADGQRRHHAVEPMGDGDHRGLHRGAAACGRGFVAVDRHRRRKSGAAGRCC